MIYYHTDVFGNGPLSGNGLTVVIAKQFPEKDTMQKIAQEFKQYETIFLVPNKENSFFARIFTVQEELDFAGHPVLGAAAVLCREFFGGKDSVIELKLPKKTVIIECKAQGDAFYCVMRQGKAQFLGETAERKMFAEAFSLKESDLRADLPLEVVSTGLPYLIIPLASGIERAKIVVNDLEERLAEIGAKFAYLVDIDRLEGRNWDNTGADEDVATGSAAGPVGAYLCKYGMARFDEQIELSQGRFLQRPSRLSVCCAKDFDVTVGGRVDILAKGELFDFAAF